MAGIALVHAQVADARMTPFESRENCRGVQQLRDLLLHRDGGSGGSAVSVTTAATPAPLQPTTAELLATCVRPLLYMSYKWASPADAVAYCKQDACVQVVATLQRLPTCTWEHIPSDAESDLLIAQRVLEDCTDAKHAETEAAIVASKSVHAKDESGKQ